MNHRLPVAPVLFLAPATSFAVAWGCGSAPDARSADEAALTETSGTVAPASDAERQLLAALSDLPPNQERVVAGLTVHCGEPYTAASGRSCRQVALTGANGAPQRKVACQDEGRWSFVPNVFGADGER